jgi:Zn-dependent protease
MYFRKGYLVLRRAPSVPLMLHWSVLMLPLLASGFSYQPGAWVAAFVIILVHELGHAVAVWQARGHVTAILMDGTGGTCQWTGHVTLRQRLVIVWGGILAQLLLFGLAVLLSLIFSASENLFLQEFLTTMLRWNLIVIAFNLLPIPSLDGYEAWPLLKQVWQGWQRRRRQVRNQRLTEMTRKQMEELDRLEASAPPNQEIKEVVNELFRRAAEEHKAKQKEVEPKNESYLS